MNNEKKFKTKTGFCHILPDKIILTRDGIIGNLAKVTVGNNIARILIVYGIITAGIFYAAFLSYQKGQIFQPIILVFAALLLINGIIISLSNSATPIIERSKIKEVKFKKAIPGLTRSRFEVLFEDERGKIKKRIIMLPGYLDNRQNETEKAVQIMTEEKLITKS